MKKKWVFGGVAGVLVAAVVGAGFWFASPLRAEPERYAEVASLVEDAGEGLVLRPATGATGRGLLFVPGARVQAEAYAWTFAPLLADGTTVVIARPTLGFAILDRRGMGTFTALAPEVTAWQVGGHSLGGVRACQYAAEEPVERLVLFGSYCADDLSAENLHVLSIGGEMDGLSTPQDIADNAGKLPTNARFIEIKGMCHAQFGAYGEQSGDGTPTIDDTAARDALISALR
ncbi:alpha/beta hydrolase [Catenuloplanes japonicus]|uniref:alpha/beta hydrolase n=1 Tax=Catenuloplanes japonicus TaxID=33876 RepID=UPI00052553D4|nr:alpha/beta hydrolase [Catenuloplanes japonicus]